MTRRRRQQQQQRGGARAAAAAQPAASSSSSSSADLPQTSTAGLPPDAAAALRQLPDIADRVLAYAAELERRGGISRRQPAWWGEVELRRMRSSLASATHSLVKLNTKTFAEMALKQPQQPPQEQQQQSGACFGPAFWSALYRLVAVAVRLPSPALCPLRNPNSERAAPTDLYMILSAACSCCGTAILWLFLGLPADDPRVAQLALSRASTLLRMQTLQACSRQMAHVAEVLRAHADAADADEAAARGAAQPRVRSAPPARQQPTAQHFGRLWRELLALTEQRYDLACAAQALDRCLPLLARLSWCAKYGRSGVNSVASTATAVYCSELSAALYDSQLLEHLSRVLLLLLLLMYGTPYDDDHEVYLTRFSYFMIILAQLGWVQPLQRIVAGPCCWTAVLSLGVAALCVGDGGPSYGIPPELLGRITKILRAGEQASASSTLGPTAATTASAVSHKSSDRVWTPNPWLRLAVDVMRTLLGDVSGLEAAPEWLTRRVAAALLRRVERLLGVVEAAAGPQPGPSEEPGGGASS